MSDVLRIFCKLKDIEKIEFNYFKDAKDILADSHRGKVTSNPFQKTLILNRPKGTSL